MHSQSDDLGESVWTVSSSGVCESVRASDSLLRHETLPVDRVEDGGTHENLQDSESSGEVHRKTYQIRFTGDCKRTPAWDRIQAAYREAALEEAKRVEKWLGGGCPKCNRKPGDNDAIMVRWDTDGSLIYSCSLCYQMEVMPEWKKQLGRQILSQPYLEEPNRGNGAW